MINKLIPLLASAFLLNACVVVSVNDEQLALDLTEAEKHEDIYHIRQSQYDFDTTLNNIRAGIEKRGLRIFTEIDYADGARSVDMTLEPTTLVIFGNPLRGTPMVKDNRYMGMELPLKALVFEEDGVVTVSILRVEHLIEPFELEEAAPVARKVNGVLVQMLEEATGTN